MGNLQNSLDSIDSIPFSEKIVLNSLMSMITQKSQLEGVILFGSRARRDHRSDSDTDVMVITKTLISDNDQLDIYNNLTNLNRQYKADVSLSLITREEWDNPSLEESFAIKHSIQSEGIEIAIPL